MKRLAIYDYMGKKCILTGFTSTDFYLRGVNDGINKKGIPIKYKNRLKLIKDKPIRAEKKYRPNYNRKPIKVYQYGNYKYTCDDIMQATEATGTTLYTLRKCIKDFSMTRDNYQFEFVEKEV